MCARAKGNLMPGASSRLEAESPNDAGRYDGRGEDRGSPAARWRATRLSRLARPVSDQRHFVALLYTLSRDTTLFPTEHKYDILRKVHLFTYAYGVVVFSVRCYALSQKEMSYCRFDRKVTINMLFISGEQCIHYQRNIKVLGEGSEEG